MPIKKSQGFALIDTIVAIFLIGVAFSAFSLIYPALKLSQISRSYMVAAAIAEKKMEELKYIQFDSLDLAEEAPFSDPDFTKLQNVSADYSVTYYDINNDEVDETDIKEITVNLNWEIRGESRSYFLTSLSYQYGLAR